MTNRRVGPDEIPAADLAQNTVLATDLVRDVPMNLQPDKTPDAVPVPEPGSAATAVTPTVKWDTRQLKSSYVNFANANSTQEEVVLNFGMNNNWDRHASEVEIELAHRIVMSPFAAKRLAELLGKLVSQYEQRYGVLK
jgi:hypothetical protein